MEYCKLQFGEDAAFDEAVRSGLKEGGDLAIITKDRATQEGRAAACITFTVQLPDGRPARAQCVVPVRVLTAALMGLRGRYGDDGIVQPHLAQ